MMKYVEELSFGDLFIKNDIGFIKTTDFKKSKESRIKYLCISLYDGSSSWIDGNSSVETLDLYKRDEDGNILSFKTYKDPYQASTES